VTSVLDILRVVVLATFYKQNSYQIVSKMPTTLRAKCIIVGMYKIVSQ